MAYVLQDLLKVRLMREQWAKDELIKAQNALEDAIRKVEEKKKALEDYRKWRVEEEERLFQEILNKMIKRLDIDSFKMKFAELEKKELEHIQAIEMAENERDKAKEKLEEARKAYNMALVNVQKLEEHKTTWMVEWNKKQELRAEKEMEDFKVTHTNI